MPSHKPRALIDKELRDDAWREIARQYGDVFLLAVAALKNRGRRDSFLFQRAVDARRSGGGEEFRWRVDDWLTQYRFEVIGAGQWFAGKKGKGVRHETGPNTASSKSLR